MSLVFLKNEQDFAHNRFKKSVSSSSLRIRTAILNQNSPRFGFIVPKKVLPNVTDRNKVKRRIKGIILKHLLEIKPFDILIFPYSGSLKKSYLELESELIGNLKKVGAWKSSEKSIKF